MKKLLIAVLATLLLFTVPALGSYGRRAYLVSIVDALHETNTEVTSFEVKIAGSTTATIYANASTTTAATNPIVDSSTATDITTLTTGYVVFWYVATTCDISLSNGTYAKSYTSVNPRNTRLMYDSILYSAMSDWTLLDTETMTFGTTLDWVAGAADSGMDWTPAADNSAFYIGTTAKTSDLFLYGATANYDLQWDATRNHLTFRDNVAAAFGAGAASGAADYTIKTAGSTGALIVTAVSADDAFQVGDGTIATDFILQNTTTSTADVWWDDSAEIFHFGVTNYGVDVKFWADTASEYAIWDESIDTLSFVGSNIKLDDSSIIYLGTGTNAATADGDVTLQFDGTNLELFATAIDTPFAIGGTTTNGFDITYYFETSGQFRTDYDADFINLTDDMELRFGTGASSDGDIKISSNSTNVLQIEQVVLDTGTITFGADGRDIPIIWYAETASAEITTTGDTRIFDGVDVTHNDDDIVNFGDSAEITMQYDEDGDDNLQIKGAVDIETTYVEFRQNPMCTADAGGGAATGTAGDENLLLSGSPAYQFEYHIVGTATAVAPVIGAEGLDIGLDDVANDGIEITEGITARSNSAFTMGTDAFYLEVKFYVTDASGSDVMMIGFRSDEAYQSDIEIYTDMAAVGLNGVDWYTWTIDDDGATTKTDVTPSGGDCGDTESHIVRINVGADLAVTYEITGAEPTGVAAHDIDTGDVVLPFLYLIHDTDASEAFQIISWECGLQ